MKIGITGGIGAGKSVVSDMLRQMGYMVYDSDSEAKHLMSTDPDIINRLTLRYGSDIYIDGKINRTKLASIIFNNNAEIAFVNSIVHPAVCRDYSLKASDLDISFIESAIIFEAHLDQYIDAVIFVEAPIKTRIDRVILRDNTSRAKIIERINNQNTSRPNHLCITHYTINNDGIQPLKPQLDNILTQIKVKSE